MEPVPPQSPSPAPRERVARSPGASRVRLSAPNPLIAPSPHPSPPMGARVFPGVTRRVVLAAIAAALMPGPFAARAQAQGGMRRLGALMGWPESDPLGQALAAALVQGLGALNWHEGGNLHIDWRWAGSDATLYVRHAAELVSLAPEVLVAANSPAVAALRRQTKSIPIVFVGVADPVGQGFVESLARPGGTITGFSFYDPPIAGKWLQMLTQITPRVARVAVLYNPATAPYAGLYLRAIEEAARSLAVAVRAAPYRDDAEIEAIMAGLAHEGTGGLLLLPQSTSGVQRATIIALATRYSLPGVYSSSTYAAAGGLMSYSSNLDDLFGRSAAYVDRILKGATPADLPVQNPTKFEMVINLKTAKALGVTIPPSLLAAADEVIE
jgi:putative ABC transport system substrate-binding protein